jgi:RNA polymerase sigma-70 factor (ECF subfamily)
LQQSINLSPSFPGNYPPDEIVAGIASGDKKFESILIKQYFNGLLFILNKQAKCYELSADIAQETFIVVIRKARENHITNPKMLKAFIRQVGINLLIAHYRKESRQATSTDPHIDLSATESIIEIHKSLHDQKLLKQVTQFILAMPIHRDKTILQYYFVYEKNKEEICIDLEIDSAHFDRVLFRSRERLKKIIHAHLSTHNETSKVTITSLLTIVLTTFVTYQLSHDLKKTNLSMREYTPPQHYKEKPIISTEELVHFDYPLLTFYRKI